MLKGQQVYVSSDDRRMYGFDATVVSIGSKFITVADKCGRKYRFNRETLWCVDWSIYHLHESVGAYKHDVKMNKVCSEITRNLGKIFNQLSEDEIIALYNKIPNATPYGEL